MTNIQYSYGGNGTVRKVKNCDFFPGFLVSKEQRQCLGVKVCEFASKELDNGHSSVDFTKPLFKNTLDANEKFHEKATLWSVKFGFFFNFFILIRNLIRNKYYCSVFATAYEYKCEHINQNGIRCNGAPKLGELTQVSQNNTNFFYEIITLLII